jgi:hypothetical protein
MNSPTRARRVALAVVALGLTVSACGSADSDDEAVDTPAPSATVDAAVEPTEPATTDESTTEPTTDASTDPTTDDDATTGTAEPPPVAVPEALAFTAPLVGGGEFDGASVADKPTVFWFWAPT